MRIWLLTSQLPPEIVGGIARYVDNFARLLGAAGHEVLVITRTRQAYDRQLVPGVRVIGLQPLDADLPDLAWSGSPAAHPAYPYNVIGHWPAFSYELAQKSLELLQELPLPDVIEAQEYNALPYYLLQRKLTEPGPLEGVPIVVHTHSPYFDIARINQEPRYRFPGYWLGQMEKFCLVAADALVSPSRYLAQSLEQTLQRPLDVSVIPYPYIGDDAPPPTPTQPEQIVYVGRLEIRKGIMPLLRACQQLWLAGHTFRLTIVGGDTPLYPKGMSTGEYLRQRYARWIEQGQLEMLGELDYETALAQMRSAWAVLVPSVWDNFPNTCIEAMAAGQVVLASRAGGQAEMVETDGRNGFIFDWEIPGDFERQLTRILALPPGERQQIAQQAQQRIRQFCAPEVILPQRLQHFQRVVEQYQPRRLFPSVHLSLPAEPIQQPAAEQADLLSVIIPFYNLGPYLGDTLESILHSHYSPLEVIIVNDGSTDPASLAVLQEFEARRLPQLKIIHTGNQGLASARNTGALAAQGQFIAFVDADDQVEADFFNRAVAVLQRYPNVAFVYSWVRFFEGSEDIWPTWNAEFPYLLGHNMLTPLAVVRRSAFLALGQNNPVFEYNFEDYESWLRLLAAGGLGVSLPFLLVRYRVRPGSMYQTATPDQFMYLYDLLSQQHPELYRQWGAELFNLQNTNGPGRVWNHPAAWVNIDQLRQQIQEQQAQIYVLRHRLDSIYRWLPLPQLKKLQPEVSRAVFKALPPRSRRWLIMQRQAFRVGRISRQPQISQRPPLSKPTQLKGLKVLMVFPDMGAPTRYRVSNQAAQMELLGMQPLLYNINDAHAVEALAEAQLLYFHRAEDTPITRKLALLARQQRLPLIFDTDDLTWDPDIESFCFLRQNWPPEKVDEFLRGVKRHAKMMAQADYFVVSTSYLAGRLQAEFKQKIFVHPNSISAALQNLSTPFYRAKQAQGIPGSNAPVTLAYFSGWERAHQEDFEVVLEPLRQILRDRPQVQLKVVGYLNLNGLFPGFEARVQLQEFVDWQKLPQLTSQVDINLAPIVDNPHRRSKSAIKYMEAALVGVPTVASNLEPYQEIQPGITGFLASNPGEWYDRLITLIDTPDLRFNMGLAARQQVLSQATVQLRAVQFKEIIQEIIEDYYG